MHRFLTPLPAVYDLGQLGALTATFWPGLLGCNIVDDDGTPSLAVYLEDDAPSGLDGWAAAVAAHVPVTEPVVDLTAEIIAAKASLAAATTIAQVRTRTVALFDLLNQGA